MFDFRGHGENKESFISIGFIEVKDLEAAVAWLNELGYENPGVLGFKIQTLPQSLSLRERLRLIESSLEYLSGLSR